MNICRVITDKCHESRDNNQERKGAEESVVGQRSRFLDSVTVFEELVGPDCVIEAGRLLSGRLDSGSAKFSGPASCVSESGYRPADSDRPSLIDLRPVGLIAFTGFATRGYECSLNQEARSPFSSS